jgi:hypothetical protein
MVGSLYVDILTAGYFLYVGIFTVGTLVVDQKRRTNFSWEFLNENCNEDDAEVGPVEASATEPTDQPENPYDNLRQDAMAPTREVAEGI